MRVIPGGGDMRMLLLVAGMIFSLSSWGQGLPDGAGRDEVLRGCTACHGLDNITDPARPLTADDWTYHVYDMVARGAPVYPEDIEVIRRYLVDNFAVDN